jgi:peroxin-12
MSFVSLGGDGLRPTFFEMVAAERLMPSLKSAVIYSLSVYAQRRPGLQRLLDREDELFFLLSVLLDRQALAASGGSFAEGLYALRRAPVAADSSGVGGSSRPLSTSQRQMSLILLVSPEDVHVVLDSRGILVQPAATLRSSPVAHSMPLPLGCCCRLVQTLVPFLRSRLDSLYHQLHSQQHQQQQHQQHPQQQQRNQQQPEAWRHRWRAVARAAFLRLYPWVFAEHEGARFAYQLLYLLGRTPYYSPGLHLLGLQVVRLTGQEAVRHGCCCCPPPPLLLFPLAAAASPGCVPDAPVSLWMPWHTPRLLPQTQQDRDRLQRRAERLSRLGHPEGGPWLWRLLRQGWARAGYAAADHTRSALILSVFAFKVGVWAK